MTVDFISGTDINGQLIQLPCLWTNIKLRWDRPLNSVKPGAQNANRVRSELTIALSLTMAGCKSPMAYDDTRIVLAFLDHWQIHVFLKVCLVFRLRFKYLLLSGYRVDVVLVFFNWVMSPDSFTDFEFWLWDISFVCSFYVT